MAKNKPKLVNQATLGQRHRWRAERIRGIFDSRNRGKVGRDWDEKEERLWILDRSRVRTLPV